MAEALSRNIKHHHLSDKWKGAKIEDTTISVTHSLFANDTLLFGSSLVAEAKQIKKILSQYLEVSRQKINPQKSEIFLFNTNKVISDKTAYFRVF